MKKIETVLKEYYGYDHFRPGQEELIEAILKGQDALGIMPTGGGKSLCYQIPAICMEGTGIVISPLISLMKDQVDALQTMGVRAGFINSQLDKATYLNTMDKALFGYYDLLYIAPERIASEHFLNTISHMNINMVAVDEAHCISQWGQDFRPSYQTIPQLRDIVPEHVPFAAFTATATTQVQEDISQQLRLQKPNKFVASFDRPNLYFSVVQSKKKSQDLLSRINEEGSTIIYCNTRKNVESVYHNLVKKGFDVTYYHAGISAEERIKNQDDFIYDRKPIMVATNAFGMGIDKSNVRKVIHYNMPLNMESYYQEAGRAGRDGAPSEAILFYSGQDIITNTFLIEQGNQPHAKEKLNRMITYCKTGQCLRAYILNYFDEHPEWERCEQCSNCDGHTETIDVTVDCQKILSCIHRMDQRFGAGMVTDVLRGKNNQRIRSLQFDQLSTYGIMAKKTDERIKDIISLMIGDGYLALSGDKYPILTFTNKTNALLQAQDKLLMTYKIVDKVAHDKVDTQEYDKELFEALKKLRFQISKEIGKPPFVVFTDKSLISMASQLPTNDSAFLAIHGVGQSKLATYGAEFMAVIEAHKK
ncbi:ATP-dependent DNA helicase RecQ [Jeotgalibaca dankookensis]|uniref:DNA helicase RecQ n=1 Tax=Jeotgalibaca dankookensis TaxID=708126 RepID=A0A1S6IPU1_9LACT|nr:DNA helicase RecQ [Jeotgalibaca dankookensis]AQS53573.1 ATP-dependent DNA helicase RecQ [Jeotgalibaca dankookensis]